MYKLNRTPYQESNSGYIERVKSQFIPMLSKTLGINIEANTNLDLYWGINSHKIITLKNAIPYLCAFNHSWEQIELLSNCYEYCQESITVLKNGVVDIDTFKDKCYKDIQTILKPLFHPPNIKIDGIVNVILTQNKDVYQKGTVAHILQYANFFYIAITEAYTKELEEEFLLDNSIKVKEWKRLDTLMYTKKLLAWIEDSYLASDRFLKAYYREKNKETEQQAPMQADSKEETVYTIDSIGRSKEDIEQVQVAGQENPKEAHTRKGDITQATMARMCGVSRKTIQNWEKGIGTPYNYCGLSNLALCTQFANNYKSIKAVNREGRNIRKATTGYNIDNYSQDYTEYRTGN